MDSRSSTVNMDSGVVHSTIFGSLLFVKAYLFYPGICTRALYSGYVSSLRQGARTFHFFMHERMEG